jgi:hypothetical protein
MVYIYATIHSRGFPYLAANHSHPGAFYPDICGASTEQITVMKFPGSQLLFWKALKTLVLEEEAVVSVSEEEMLISSIRTIEPWTTVILTNCSDHLPQDNNAAAVAITQGQPDDPAWKGIDSSIDINSPGTEFIMAIDTPQPIRTSSDKFTSFPSLLRA